MEIKILDKPTVKDIIEFLKTLPEDTPFRLEDADTCWEICTIHVDDRSGKIFFSGFYSEMI